MRLLQYFGSAAALAVLLIATPTHAELLATADLFAGQDLDVGDVTITDIGSGMLEVEIQIQNPAPDGQDWCLQKVHIEVADDETEIPQNNKGNPKVGQFEVNDSVDCSLSETYQFDLPAGDFVVAVHTIVDTEATCQSSAVLYGTRRIPDQGNLGEIYKIDVLNDTVTLVADFADPAGDNQNSPNGLGYDPVNDVLYFSATDLGASQSDLYSVAPNEASPGTVVINNLGTLNGESAGATFNAGNYWYVLNDDDDLQQVTFGPFNDSTNQVSFSGDARTLRFGDVVFKPNSTTLLGSSLSSTTSNPDTPELFFSLSGSGTYTELCEGGDETVGGCAGGLQISFGSNGLLYGHSTGNAAWFEIDPDTGLITDDSLPISSGFEFTDLASGELCVPDEETAWGDGLPFASTGANGKRSGSWATYIDVSNP